MGRIVAYAVKLFVSKVIFPALRALSAQGFLFIREKELKAKLKKYMEANTNEEFDDAFDDLIAGSKLQ